MTAITNIGVCAFCSNHGQLCESHVIPAFVYRWLKGRSGTGYIRNTATPNRRDQDGLKLFWLCRSCEDIFGRFETEFATKIFHPWHKGETRLPYNDWLIKFCASLSWRVLRYARGRNPDAHYSDEQSALMTQATERWRAFLLDEVEHPGQFEQHLVIFDLMSSTTAPNLPSNFNRFITGAVTLDIIGSDRSLMTFAKLGRFTVFGIIQKGSNVWKGTKVSVKRGVLQPSELILPAGLLSLLVDKARHVSAATDTISLSQRAKIDDTILANIDRFRNSDQFASMQADAKMFGESAVLWKKD